MHSAGFECAPRALRCTAAACGLLLGTTLVGWSPRAAAQEGYQFGSGPQFRAMGFADVDYLETDGDQDEGFVLGQAVGHLIGDLGDRLHFFSELSATARPNETHFEIERLFLRYDFNDAFKLSAGRFHTPIGYWNTAYHHGAWLQTTVGRPNVVRFGSEIIPIHFVGMMLEGQLLGTGIGYSLGVGNGRSEIISRAGDAGDVNGERAWTAEIHGRPIGQLRLGASAYFDRATPATTPEVDERIYSAYALWQSDRPEVLAEYYHFDHEEVDGPGQGSGDAAYLQLAWQFTAMGQRLRPYARVEDTNIDPEDPLLGATNQDYQAGIVGLRWDFSPYAAIKAEYRNEQVGDAEHTNSIYLQICVVLAGWDIASPSLTHEAGGGIMEH